MNFIVNYLSQIALLVTIFFTGIGYLLKLYFVWSIRKKEILFSKIKESKIAELKEFYNSYVDLEFALRNLYYASAQSQIEKESEIRKRLPDLWKKFYMNMTFLKIFLYDDELELINELDKELNNIYLKIDFYQIDKEFGNVDPALRKELIHIREVVFEKNFQLF
jgi:hypothetical protein